MIDLLPIALRVHTRRIEKEATKSRRASSRLGPRWGELVLILDTETRTDASQALTFGSARLCCWKSDARLECVREYLFHSDDLEKQDPHGFACLKKYAREHRKEHRLELVSRRTFLDRVFWLAFKSKTLIAGFNLPFDLSRLSVTWTEGRERYANGFSLVIWDLVDKATGKRRENRFRPRVRIKHLDSKRALMGVATAGSDPVRVKLLDLRTLAFALTDEGHSLASACTAFGVEHGKLETKGHGQITEEYIDYNRRDVLATQELLEKLRMEFDRHPVDLDPKNAMSPASVAKGYLKKMGIKPPGAKFDDLPVEVTAAAMMAYYGGRAECRIRKTVVSVVYCDFVSMYPTVNALIGLWRMLTAAKLRAMDATKDVQNLLDRITLDQCFDRATWKDFNFIAWIEPHEDILPVRAPYSDGGRAYNIAVNPLTCHRPTPFAGPDLVVAKLLSPTGRSPRVIKAWRLIPHGTQSGLQPIKLRNEIEVDPIRDDFFRSVVEQRKALPGKELPPDERARLDRFLKILANSGSYGIYAQLDRIDLPGSEKETLEVYGLDGPFPASTNVVERPGEFYFPPLAALITSGARLMLALLEKCVAAAGGNYAICDTDSMAIALPMQRVREIVARFEALNPYDRLFVPGSILKIEKENLNPQTGNPLQLFCYAIAAKRYALFHLDRMGKITIRKDSEHGLGHLLNPVDPEQESRDWIREVWRLIVSEAAGGRVERPEWMKRPAISRVTATTPELVLRLQSRRRTTYADSVKPMNFLLAAHVPPLQTPVPAAHFQLIAPFNLDPRRWASMTWTDYYSGERYAISTTGNSGSDVVRVKSHADVFEEYCNHAEPKSIGPDGEPCGRATSGELGRRPVFGMYPIYVGKESNRLDEVEQGTVHDWEQVRSEYSDPSADPWKLLVVPILKMMNGPELARRAGVTERHVARLRNGRQMPSAELRDLLTQIAAEHARSHIGSDAPVDDLAACALYLHQADANLSGPDRH